MHGPLLYTVGTMAGPNIQAESPFWDHERNVLYYVDVKSCKVHKHDPVNNTHSSVQLDGMVSLVIPVKGEDDRFVIAMGKKIAIMTWDGESTRPSNVEIIASVENEVGKERHRIKGGKADARGRLWAGTVAPHFFREESKAPKTATLFSMAADRVPVNHLTNVGISSGIAWSLDSKFMYYVDSSNNNVVEYDFNDDEGTITNSGGCIFRLLTHKLCGIPDGITIDSKGYLWIAINRDGTLVHMNPNNGGLIKKIHLFVSQITGAVWGGPYLDELYVTTGTEGMTAQQRMEHPAEGYVYRITGLRSTGLPGHPVVL